MSIANFYMGENVGALSNNSPIISVRSFGFSNLGAQNLPNQTTVRVDDVKPWEIVKTLAVALLTVISAIAVWEFQGVKSDISTIQKDANENNVKLIKSVDEVALRLATTNQKLDDLKAVLHR